MENISEKDFVNVLCLRNQLVNVDIEELRDVYKDYDNYLTFLDSVVVLTQVDSAFLLYRDNFIKKIEDIIQIHRYKIKDKNVLKVINEIILYLNEIKSYTTNYRKLLREAYESYNEDIRKINFSSSKELLYALGYDAVVYAAITGNNMNLITQDYMFLSSINYLLETIPSVFDKKGVKDRTLEKITKLERSWSPFNMELRKYSRITQENFQKVKKKGE